MSMTLGGYTLPTPHEYEVDLDYPGGIQVMADNSVVEDHVTAAVKRRWTMAFRALTSAQVTTMRSVFAAVAGASASFTDLESGTYTVTRDESMRSIKFTPTAAAGGKKWSCSLMLREV